jgi:hypothetical protein
VFQVWQQRLLMLASGLVLERAAMAACGADRLSSMHLHHRDRDESRANEEAVNGRHSMYAPRPSLFRRCAAAGHRLVAPRGVNTYDIVRAVVFF